jgi:hypothetical protein
MIIESRGNADRARRQIVTADHGEIARGVIAAAIGTDPRRPASLADRRWQRPFDDRASGILGAAAALDEGIKHQVEKLVGELEGHLLRPGRNLAGELIERVGQIAAGQPKEG